MKRAIPGALLLVVGVALVIMGVLPAADALAIGNRTWPILLFVLAITIVTELASEAEVFRVAAVAASTWGRGRTVVLWLIVVGLAVACTILLSLDTTAVLLTPVVVLLARHSGLAPLPFALTTVWLANTASLLLPVSNLTNLLAQHALGGISPAGFAALMAAPALVAILVPTLALGFIFRRRLAGRYQPPSSKPAKDTVLLVVGSAVIIALVPLLVSGIAVWIPAVGAAVVLIVFFGVRRPTALRPALVPWQLLLLASGLFLVVEALHSVGVTRLLTEAIPTGRDPLSLLGLAGAAAGTANVVNNLPAYLLLENTAGDPVRIAAVLIGVNAGCLITPWASLATLLWAGRLRSLGVDFSWRQFVGWGLIVAPCTVAAATLALVMSQK